MKNFFLELRREKKERSGLLENSLAMIDEGMIECGKDKYITERWLSSSPSSSTSGNQSYFFIKNIMYYNFFLYLSTKNRFAF